MTNDRSRSGHWDLVIGHFACVATIGNVDFKLQPSLSISQITARRGERVGVDLFQHPQFEQAVLLVTNLHQCVSKLRGFRR